MFLKKHIKLKMTLFLFLAICFLGVPAKAKYGGGTGGPNDPYLIFDANHMNAIGADSNDWDKNFKLMADIDLSQYDGKDGRARFNTIGYYGCEDWCEGVGFTGVFDGNSCTISNLTVNFPWGAQGLFSHLDGGTITNLGLVDPCLVGSYCIGALVGQLTSGTISHCYIEGGYVVGSEVVGGLVGGTGWCFFDLCYGTHEVSDCYVVGTVVSGGSCVGGLIGFNMGSGNLGIITECYSRANVISGGSFAEHSAGGLVGYNGGTITLCHSSGSVVGESKVGGLVGVNARTRAFDYSGGIIEECYSTANVDGNDLVGGLLGLNEDGMVTNCCATGDVEGESNIGGFIGSNYGTIVDCNANADVIGVNSVGGLAGSNMGGTIMKCHSGGVVLGVNYVGGLVGLNKDICGWCGVNYAGKISDCYSTSTVHGESVVGGLVGENIYKGCHYSCLQTPTESTQLQIPSNITLIVNCYSQGDVSGYARVGGLVGQNGSEWMGGTITNCYSTGGVEGADDVGGLVGHNEPGVIASSFWDIETSGQDWSAGGTGLPTDQMQITSTFIDANWDFITPIWTIDEGVDYPRLWWEFAPVLNAEPEVTLGTSNTISWEPVVGEVEYYAVCAEDENFTSIVHTSGWIVDTNCVFTDLEMGKVYWYSVKARNAEGTESQWSNVEFSFQLDGTLADAVEILLNPENLKNENMKKALLNKINMALELLDEGLNESSWDKLEKALDKLENDILSKMDGCAETGEPDKNDWIVTCEGQSQIYPLVIETIEYLRSLLVCWPYPPECCIIPDYSC